MALGAQGAGVVDEHVEALVIGENRRGERTYLAVVAHVRRYLRKGLIPRRLGQLADDGLVPLGDASDQDERGPTSGELESGRMSQTRGCPREQDNLAGHVVAVEG